MDIYAKPGTVVIYTGAGGMENDKKTANDYLTVGNPYTVESTEVSSWSSTVILKEVTAKYPSGSRVSFNTVMFKHKDEHLSTIKVRSKDGFSFTLDVSQIIHIPALDAPKVIARFGSLLNLVQQVLEPTVGNYFRNSAQESDIISFLSDRKTRQDEARTAISNVLVEYNVQAVDTLIGDIVPPEELMKTLTDRKIAQEQETTYITECKAQDQRKMLESAKALADMQGQMVNAQQSVEIAQREAEASVKKAEGNANAVKLKAGADAEAKKIMAEAEAKQIELTGNAEAGKIEAIGKATAESYEKQVKAMGEDNFAKFKIIEEVGKNGIKLIPEILITGGNGGDGNSSMNGLATLEMLKYVEGKRATPANKQSSTDSNKKA